MNCKNAVSSIVDFFLVLLSPGGGDELQGIKRGVMELADALLVNKADGDTRELAQRTRLDYQNALALIRPTSSAWKPVSLAASAQEGQGIDEVWGEPFKAFTMPVPEFYQSRFIKIAQSMRDIDLIAGSIIENFCANPLFAEIEDLIGEYAAAAKEAAATMKKDPIIFRVWPNFVALGEQIEAYKPELGADAEQILIMRVAYGRDLIQEGKGLIGYIASARVPMPLSTDVYIEKCRRYRKAPVPRDTDSAGTGA